jgi:catechol 2,3-dioxygenase-like lactoylglutathione lyase family enzyme
MAVPRIRLDHVRLDVANIARSADYYSRIFELAHVIDYVRQDRAVLQMAPLGLRPGFELWCAKGAPAGPHATQCVAFSASDVPLLVELILTAGYPIVSEPFRRGDETVAIVQDPDGHIVEINDSCGRGLPEWYR